MSVDHIVQNIAQTAAYFARLHTKIDDCSFTKYTIFAACFSTHILVNITDYELQF